MNSSIKSEAGFAVLRLTGEVDLHCSPELREEIMRLLNAGKSLLIDMRQVSYIDSSAIALLVEGFQLARSGRLSYGLLNISGAVMQILKLTRLDKIFPLYNDVEQFQEQIFTKTRAIV